MLTLKQNDDTISCISTNLTVRQYHSIDIEHLLTATLKKTYNTFHQYQHASLDEEPQG